MDMKNFDYCKRRSTAHRKYGPCTKCAKEEAIKRDEELRQSLKLDPEKTKES